MPDGSETDALLNLPPSLHAAVRLVCARPDLQSRLGAEYEAAAFCAVLRSIADDHAIAIDEPDLQAVLRPDPLGLGRFAAAPITSQTWPGPGWLPARSVPGSSAGGLPEPAFDCDFDLCRITVSHKIPPDQRQEFFKHHRARRDSFVSHGGNLTALGLPWQAPR